MIEPDHSLVEKQPAGKSEKGAGPGPEELRISDLLDLDQLQSLLSNFCEAVGIASAIIDLKGKVLVAARWQRACTDFHRTCEISCQRCIESDTELAIKLEAGHNFTIYQCKNGMTDAASPIIIDGRHLANVFIGQFHLQEPDLEFFRRQARECGFDEPGYLAAIQEAPVISGTKLPSILGFLSGFARMVASLSLERRRALQATEVMEQRAEELRRSRSEALSLAEDAEQARREIMRYKEHLEHLVEERTEELRKSEEQARLLLERLDLTLGATGIGIWERDLLQHRTIWDQATQALFGYNSTALPDYSEIFQQRVHPDDLERIGEVTRQAIAGTVDYNTEFRVIWPDASLHVLAARAMVLRDANGLPRRIIGTCWDITDNKEREQLARLGSEVGDALTILKPLKARLQLCAEALVNQLDAALARIWIVNEQVNLLEMQGSAGIHTRTDGTYSRIPVGKYKIGRIAKEARLRFSNNVGEESDVDDKEWVKQNKLVGFVGHPLVVEDRVVGVMAFFSRTKLNPNTVHALSGIAKTIAVSVDRDRAERELKQARVAAEAATKAKSYFLANMSHELRTPMNAILGYSEMLMEEAEDQGQEDFIPDLQKIHTAGKHLLGLINEILDLSKIEAGKMELFLESFDVAGMINEVANTLRPLVDKNANTLQVHLAPDLGAMQADLTKVRQSLFNLLSNASKFTEKGTITLDAETISKDGARWIAFRVADTGIGMTPEQLDKLFQPFVQADASTSRKYGGTGLGMTITQLFIKMMGGEMNVASKPGTGTTFTVLLPVEVKAPPPAEVPQPEAAEPIFLPGANTVLVIEDDPGARDLLTRFLTKEGYRVETASGGEAGLRRARELHPDIITLDVMMPDMDGWAVLSELKADPELADIPVVMLTIVDNKNLGYALGAADYLTKPIQRDRLLAILAKYCPPSEPATVLVVEDDIATREVIRHLLEKAGIQVAEAENGRVALERLAERQPGLILLDLMMPEMDGFQFVDHVRQHEAWRAIPIVVVTAKDLTAEDRLRLNGYVTDIISKDTRDQEELLAEVSKMVKARLQKGPVRSNGSA
jgi:PAS domain S-box-containing protein